MNEVVKELMPLLQKLADKLDSSAQMLWELQKQQVKVAILSYLIQYIVVLFYLYWYCIFVGSTNAKDTDDITIFNIILLIVGGFIAILLAFCVFNEVKPLLTMIFNPDYWALQEIIKMVK